MIEVKMTDSLPTSKTLAVEILRKKSHLSSLPIMLGEHVMGFSVTCLSGQKNTSEAISVMNSQLYLFLFVGRCASLFGHFRFTSSRAHVYLDLCPPCVRDCVGAWTHH